MKLNIYSVRDKKLGAYSAPKFATDDSSQISEGIARELKKLPIEKIAEAADCALYFLGTFDDVSGKFELLEQAEKLIDYEDYVPRKSEVISDGSKTEVR